MEGEMKKILMIFIGALVVSAVLVGLRGTALKSAYDAANATTITDSSGTSHTVAASAISGDTAALLYQLGVGLIWLVAVIAVVFLLIKKFS